MLFSEQTNYYVFNRYKLDLLPFEANYLLQCDIHGLYKNNLLILKCAVIDFKGLKFQYLFL